MLLAGSGSDSKRAPNRALWQVVMKDLSSPEPPFVLPHVRGSEVLDAAMAPDGKVFAVGRLTDEPGRRIGWSGFIVGSNNGALALDRRSPDTRAVRLSTLPISAGVVQLPPAAISVGASYLDENMAAGTQRDLAFSIASSTTIKISAHTDSGDIDLVITDAQKRPIDFSNFKRSATELLITTLPPGDYLISVVANAPIKTYEIRLAPSKGVTAQLLTDVRQLNEEQRLQAAGMLAEAGYSIPSDPKITLGGESIRALLAAQEGAPRDIGLGTLGKSVSQALGAR